MIRLGPTAKRQGGLRRMGLAITVILLGLGIGWGWYRVFSPPVSYTHLTLPTKA